ncbi:MAG TPA: flagellar hook-associated protein FlgL [Edaphobacter sp.]
MRVDPNFVTNLSSSLDQSQSVEANLTSQLSSGLRVTTLADDPGAAAQASMIDSEIAQDDQYVQTASNESSMLQVTDSALGEVVTQLTSAVTLAVQGSNGTLDAANLSAIAQQLTGIRDQLLSLANTSYQGNYLFAGSQGSAQPFTLDTSTSPATVNYAGDTNVQYVTTPTGQKLQVNLPGSSIFGTGTTGVLGALNQLIADFSGGTAGSTSAADSAALTTAIGQVSQQRSVLDTSLSRLQATSTYVQTEETELKAQQSNLVASDTASVATQLKSAEVQNEALMNVISALEKNNLFDYIQ